MQSLVIHYGNVQTCVLLNGRSRFKEYFWSEDMMDIIRMKNENSWSIRLKCFL